MQYVRAKALSDWSPAKDQENPWVTKDMTPHLRRGITQGAGASAALAAVTVAAASDAQQGAPPFLLPVKDRFGLLQTGRSSASPELTT